MKNVNAKSLIKCISNRDPIELHFLLLGQLKFPLTQD